MPLEQISPTNKDTEQTGMLVLFQRDQAASIKKDKKRLQNYTPPPAQESQGCWNCSKHDTIATINKVNTGHDYVHEQDTTLDTITPTSKHTVRLQKHNHPASTRLAGMLV